MAEFNLHINDHQDAELISNVNESAFSGLLSDDVVLQWLMNLEDEDTATDLDESRRENQPRRLHA
jgi:hypothetical protein